VGLTRIVILNRPQNSGFKDAEQSIINITKMARPAVLRGRTGHRLMTKNHCKLRLSAAFSPAAAANYGQYIRFQAFLPSRGLI